MTKGNDNGARFGSVVEFQTAADAYFDACDAAGKLYGEAGLCLALDVSLNTLRRWYDGKLRPELQEAVQRAYLRIQDQIETDPVYSDKVEARQDLTVNIKHGKDMSESDFK